MSHPTLLFLDASPLHALPDQDPGGLSPLAQALIPFESLARVEEMCRRGRVAEAYWYAHALAHGAARQVAYERDRSGIRDGGRERRRVVALAELHAYLGARATLGGCGGGKKIVADDLLQTDEPGFGALFGFQRDVRNPWWPQLEGHGVSVTVTRYQRSAALLHLWVGFPDVCRTQWSRRLVYCGTVTEAVREGNRLATIALAAVEATRRPVSHD